MFIVAYVLTAVYFIIATFGDWLQMGQTIGFIVIGGISLVALLHMKSDEPYYRNLKGRDVAYAVLAVGVMVLVSSIFTGAVGASVLHVPFALSLGANATGGPTSIFTVLLSQLLFTFGIVAAGEELFKLAVYAGLKDRRGWVLAAIVTVGSWALYHGLQAYSNILYVIPAFIDGLILLLLLERTHNFFTPWLGHGGYNAVGIVAAVAAGSLSGLPLFPSKWTLADFLLPISVVMWFVLLGMPAARRKRNAGAGTRMKLHIR